MISRTRFNQIVKQESGEVTREEVIHFLNDEGAKLNLEDTKEILRDVFGVEVGDTVITYSGTSPDNSDPVLTDDKAGKMFTVMDIIANTYHTVLLDIEGHGSQNKCYTGNQDSGIFCFFMDPDMIVIKHVAE